MTGVARARRRRLESERTAARLRRADALAAEVRAQVEPGLGPAGRPMGATAMEAWRRGIVDAYLALPPWERARRTWTSWGRGRRALAAVAVALAWPVLALPFRMAGLSGSGLTRAGLVILFGLVPLLALAPPRPRGRFEDPLDASRPRWAGSPAARRLRRLSAAAAVVAAGAFAIVALTGPGPGSPDDGDRRTAAAVRADRIVVERTVATACSGASVDEIRRVAGGRYRAALAGGGAVTVDIDFPGRAPTGTGAGHGHIVAGSCAAG